MGRRKGSSLEEACAYVGKGKDWIKATEEELLVGAFGEGTWDDYSTLRVIIVDMDPEKTETPKGLLKQHLYLNLVEENWGRLSWRRS